MNESYFIGWDVGGWSCDKNGKSRDAIVILNPSVGKIASPWRGNLKMLLNKADTIDDFIHSLFKQCKIPKYNKEASVILAIDTPLGYSVDFVELITNAKIMKEDVAKHSENRYLFRSTERFLFEKGFRPFSAVQDMLGSQSTKGIHLLSKFGMAIKATGVWEKDNLTIIETYPTANQGIPLPQSFKNQHKDIQDAYICAKVAEIFYAQSEPLYSPNEYGEEVPDKEGWIWAIKKEN